MRAAPTIPKLDQSNILIPAANTLVCFTLHGHVNHIHDYTMYGHKQGTSAPFRRKQGIFNRSSQFFELPGIREAKGMLLRSPR